MPPAHACAAKVKELAKREAPASGRVKQKPNRTEVPLFKQSELNLPQLLNSKETLGETEAALTEAALTEAEMGTNAMGEAALTEAALTEAALVPWKAETLGLRRAALAGWGETADRCKRSTPRAEDAPTILSRYKKIAVPLGGRQSDLGQAGGALVCSPANPLSRPGLVVGATGMGHGAAPPSPTDSPLASSSIIVALVLLFEWENTPHLRVITLRVGEYSSSTSY